MGFGVWFKSQGYVLDLTPLCARWKDELGNKTSAFPTQWIVEKLRPDLQKVFTRKAIMHSDEYYQVGADGGLTATRCNHGNSLTCTQTFTEILMKKVIISSGDPPQSGHEPAALVSPGLASGGSVMASARGPRSQVQSESIFAAPTASVSWQPGSASPSSNSFVGGPPASRNSSFMGAPHGTAPHPGAWTSTCGSSSPGWDAAISQHSREMSMELSRLRSDVMSQVHEARMSMAMQIQDLRSDLMNGMGQLQQTLASHSGAYSQVREPCREWA